MARDITELERRLIVCAIRDGVVEIKILPEEIQIKTTDMLSTYTMRVVLAIMAEHEAGECSLVHKARYTMLKVRRKATNYEGVIGK